MPCHEITYTYTLPVGPRTSFRMRFDEESFALVDTPKELPAWTELAFHRCPHCPADPDTTRNCPLAVALVEPVTIFGDVLSYAALKVEVSMEGRTITYEGQAQDGLTPLLGLLGATSGCPLLAPLRPMARFHLPFASERETVYRAASMYALGQYFRRKSGKYADLELEGLGNIYAKIGKVNLSMASRLRAAAKEDSTLNAMVLLDIYAKSVPYALEESLEELRSLYTAYL
jgi:hypothetical protein